MKFRPRTALLWASVAFGACDATPDPATPDLVDAGAEQVVGSDALDAAPSSHDAARLADAGLPRNRSSSADATSDTGSGGSLVTVDATIITPVSSDAGSPKGDAASADFVVGTTRFEITAEDDRTLPVQLWYPAEESARAEASAGHPVSEFEPPGPRRELLERLLQNAPKGCSSRVMHAAFDAPVNGAAALFPLLVYSHHLEGMRIALFSLAERLARLGFVVAAPDHSSMTLYDRTDDLQTADLLGTVLRFRLDALTIRAADVERVLDVLLAQGAESAVVPESVRGQIDPERVGVFGHSAGSMTAGVVATHDRRVRAAAYLSFPPAEIISLLDLLDQPAIEDFHVPALFMLNQEDGYLNAVGGNDFIREQFAAHPARAYLVEVRDTGHWSFADDCALIPDFADGCGQGTRGVEPYESYQNLDNEQARQIAAHHLAVFFGNQFLGAPEEALVGVASSPHEVARAHPETATRSP